MILLFLIIELAYSQSISIIDSYHNTYVLYNNSQQNPNFTWEHTLCCTPPKLQIINITNETTYENVLVVSYLNLTILEITTKAKSHSLYISASSEVKKNNITLYNYCDPFDIYKKKQKQLDTSDLIFITIQAKNDITQEELNLKFYYWVVCVYTNEFRFQSKTYGTIIYPIIVFDIIVVALFSKGNQIKSIKLKIPNPANNVHIQRWMAVQQFASQDNFVYFQGFKVTYWVYIIYLLATLIFYLFVKFIFPDNWYNIVLGIVLFFSFIFNAFYFNELICVISIKFNWNLQYKINRYIRICDIISILISFTLIFLYMFYYQPWPLSFLIALFTTGALTKLFKIISFREIFIVYVLIFIYDIIYYSVILYKNERNYTVEVLEYTNYPVLFEIPSDVITLDKLCLWWSIIDLFLPQLAIAYSYRFDLSKKSNLYFYVSLLGYVLGMILWSVSSYFLELYGRQQLSQQFFILPSIVSVTIIWVIIQDEFLNFWYGQFYDGQLINNTQFDSTDVAIKNNFEAELTSEKLNDLYSELSLEK